MKNINKKEIYISNFNLIKENFSHLTTYEAEKLTEHIYCTNLVYESGQIDKWIKDKKENFKSNVKKFPIKILFKSDQNKVLIVILMIIIIPPIVGVPVFFII